NRIISQEELKTIIGMGNQEGIINSDEKQMLRSVFEFSKTDVHEIMTPRIDMLCIDANDDIEKIKENIRNEQFSRIPVYKDTVDEIVGILYVKDVLSYLSGIKEMDDIKPFLRKAYFVPESKNAYSLLRFMQRTKTHIVMVVDEYGGVEGLVTMEDIIEELVGEIHDEHDEEELEYRALDERTFIVDARIRNDELGELLGVEIQENNDYNTISGYIMHKLGRVPHTGDIVSNDDFEVEVLSMDGNRIEEIKVVNSVKGGNSE
ncbi:MAG: hemolysin family protein, partial [Candidatus Muiribacteriaceae bacterium]